MLSTARFGTRDLARAKEFYDALAEILGAARVYDRPNLAGYKGANGGIFIIGEPLQGDHAVGNGNMVGFEAPTRAAVDAAYTKALEMGGQSEGKPGIRGDDPNGFYGAYFRDLDGNKMTVFKFGPPD